MTSLTLSLNCCINEYPAPHKALSEVPAKILKPLSKGYCLQVILTMVFLMLPALLQGAYGFINHLSHGIMWTVFLTALWLRFRWPLYIWMPMVFASFAYSGYIVSQHDDLGYNEISAIIDSYPGEVVAYLKMPGVIGMACAMIAVFCALCWLCCGKWLERKLPGEIRLHGAVLPLALLWCFAQYTLTGNTWQKQQMYPINLFAKGLDFVREVQFAKHRYAEVDYQYAGPEATRCMPRLTVVIAIGESARASNWSLYGYTRDTNPEVAAWARMTGGRSMVFSDALSAGRLTMNSVPSMLSPTTAQHFQDYCTKPSLLRVFRSSGYRTAVLSSHVRASEFWDGPCTLMKRDAAETRQLERDDQLPAALGQWLARDPALRRLAVLHLFGSHYDYADRYPESFQRFKGGNAMVDTYDNSISYTDHVLGNLIAKLEGLNDPAILFYSSDHGENLDDFGDGNIQHACREFTRFEIEVPMIFHANRAFADACPRQMAALRACTRLPVSHDNLSQTLLGIAGLTDPQIYQPAHDLSRAPYTPQPRFLINSLRDSVPEEVVRSTPHGRKPTTER
jgi:glucan phosphoethanolaminetransferase (alkaline phosphatase superfamily)